MSRYITRNDGSPLMGALVRWRFSALKKRASGGVLRPVSPPPANDEFDDQLNTPQKSHERSKSDVTAMTAGEQGGAEQRVGGNKEGQVSAKKPTSSSWVAWWSRSRRIESTGEAAQQQYSIYDSVRVPIYLRYHSVTYKLISIYLFEKNPSTQKPKDSSSASLPLPPADKTALGEKTKGITATNVKTGSVPTTPVQKPADALTPSRAQETTPKRRTAAPAIAVPPSQKRFAKTLRLTSDQLVSAYVYLF